MPNHPLSEEERLAHIEIGRSLKHMETAWDAIIRHDLRGGIKFLLEAVDILIPVADSGVLTQYKEGVKVQ